MTMPTHIYIDGVADGVTLGGGSNAALNFLGDIASATALPALPNAAYRNGDAFYAIDTGAMHILTDEGWTTTSWTGPKGDTGDTGAAGATGPPGTDGADGATFTGGEITLPINLREAALVGHNAANIVTSRLWEDGYLSLYYTDDGSSSVFLGDGELFLYGPTGTLMTVIRGTATGASRFGVRPQVGAFGAAVDVATIDDPRFTDARTPAAHTHTQFAGTQLDVAFVASAITMLNIPAAEGEPTNNRRARVDLTGRTQFRGQHHQTGTSHATAYIKIQWSTDQVTWQDFDAAGTTDHHSLATSNTVFCTPWIDLPPAAIGDTYLRQVQGGGDGVIDVGVSRIAAQFR